MNKQFIVKHGASNYYLESGSMGSFCTPPGHANRKYNIVEYCGGHEVGSMSVECAATDEHVPGAVRGRAKRLLMENKVDITEAWVSACYAYFRNCYSPDGINRNVSDCLIPGHNCPKDTQLPPEHHLAYLMVKRYDPNHTPRTDLIVNPPTSYREL